MTTPTRTIHISPLKLRITLEEMPVPVFRTVLVPAHITMARFHEIIQSVMPWDDEHLYQFMVDQKKPDFRVGPILEDDCMPDTEMLDDREISLQREFGIKRERAPFYYLYDNWSHLITFEEVTQEEREMFEGKALLLEAEGNCPPENIGGPGGYEYFLTVINDPENPQNKELRAWLEWDEDDQDPWDVHHADIDMLREFLKDYEEE